MLSIILVLVILGAVVLFVALRSQAGSTAFAVNTRLGRYGLTSAPAAALPAAVHRGPREESGVARSVSRVLARGRFGATIAQRLERADMKMTPGEYVSIWGAVFLGAALVGLVVHAFLGLLVLGVAGAVGPWFYLRRRVNKRKQAFVEQLPDIAQMMANSMRAGFSIVQSMDLVGNEAPKPAASEFERVVTEIKLGLQIDAALTHLLERQPSEDLELMVVAINVQRQIGGNLSEILSVIAHTVRQRVRFQRDLKTLTAQARYSSYIITALPVCVAVVINFMDHPYESMLYTTTIGYFMLGAATVMMFVGFLVLRKIAQIEV